MLVTRTVRFHLKPVGDPLRVPGSAPVRRAPSAQSPPSPPPVASPPMPQHLSDDWFGRPPTRIAGRPADAPMRHAEVPSCCNRWWSTHPPDRRAGRLARARRTGRRSAWHPGPHPIADVDVHLRSPTRPGPCSEATRAPRRPSWTDGSASAATPASCVDNQAHLAGAPRRPRPAARRDHPVRPCPSCPSSRPTPSASTEAFAGAELAGFRALTFTALKTVVPLARATPWATPCAAWTGSASTCWCASSRSTFVVHLMQGGRLAARREAVRQAQGRAGPLDLRPTAERCCYRDGQGEAAGVWVVAGDLDRPRPRWRAWAPTPPIITVDELRAAPRRAGPCGCTGSSATSAPSPASAAPLQRDLPPGEALALRHHHQARPTTRSTASMPPSPPASTRPSPSSATATR